MSTSFESKNHFKTSQIYPATKQCAFYHKYNGVLGKNRSVSGNTITASSAVPYCETNISEQSSQSSVSDFILRPNLQLSVIYALLDQHECRKVKQVLFRLIRAYLRKNGYEVESCLDLTVSAFVGEQHWVDMSRPSLNSCQDDSMRWAEFAER